MSEATPIGQRFSQVYLERGAALRDSARFRRRLLQLQRTLVDKAVGNLAQLIESETGCEVPFNGYGHSWTGFYEEGELRDVLDSITIAYRALVVGQHGQRADHWKAGVSRILSEENLGYRLDEKGGVHFSVDEEFERSRVATLAGLGAARYASARNDFELAHAALDQDPADTRGAVRHVFDALETVFKLTFDDASRLDAATIDKKLTPAVLLLYDGAARNNVSRMLVSFREWVNGAHQYRHAQGTEQPTPPPIQLCVLIVSSGAAWLRWLIEIDAQISDGATVASDSPQKIS